MLTQTVLALALIGQCGCGDSSLIYSQACDIEGMVMASDGVVTTRAVNTALVGNTVTCYYRNTGIVRNKTYTRARVYMGGRAFVVRLPIINGCLPSVLWRRNTNGMIVSVVCDYSKQIQYQSGTVIYGQPTAAALATCTPAPEAKQPAEVVKQPAAETVQQDESVLLPVPSEETYPVPHGGDDQPTEAKPTEAKPTEATPQPSQAVPQPEELSPVPQK